MKFYDTCSLLLSQEQAFTEEFACSDVTLRELEDIKTSANKSEDVKYKARKLSRLFDENPDVFKVIVWKPDLVTVFHADCNDIKIIECACRFRDKLVDTSNFVFVTDDICCKNIASKIFHLPVTSVSDSLVDTYTGTKSVVMTDNDMAIFYENPFTNTYNLTTNEYIIVRNKYNDVVDILKWDGAQYRSVKIGTIKSDYFGNIKPYNGDIYQKCALDSMITNQVTMLKGKAGTGKSYLALGYLMSQLEKRKIDKIIVFCNTVATVNSAKIGFLPGTQTEKLLDSSIGNMLSSKLGDKMAVERLITENKLLLLPMCDIRGYDTSGMNAGIFITEAQNMDVSLMKLALQRIGDDCICIIDGDYDAQVDLPQYSGSNNGMHRMSQVFRGQDFYGEVELQNIYRSKIANVAEHM